MTADLLPPNGARPARHDGPSLSRPAASNLTLHPALARRFDGGLEAALATLRDFEAELDRLAAITAEIAGTTSSEAQAPPCAAAIAAMGLSASRLDQLAGALAVAAKELEGAGSRLLRTVQIVVGGGQDTSPGLAQQDPDTPAPSGACPH